MRIAVCITGQIRTWNQVKDNIIQNIFKDNTDVFFVCDEDLSIPSIDHEITKELQPFYDASDLDFFNSKKRGETSLENCINMFYKITKCNQFKKQHEDAHNFKYDIVARLRPDISFQTHVIFSQDRDKIFIPNNYDYGGVCDQFAYGSSDLMDKFCDLFPNIKKYVEEGCCFHPETLLDYHCKKMDLNIIRQDVGFLSILR
jgi:hypothetical protein